MKKKLTLGIILILFIAVYPVMAMKQEQDRLDSLKIAAESQINDTNKVKALYSLTAEIGENGLEQAFLYGEDAVNLALKLNWKKGEANALENLGNVYRMIHNYSNALTNLEKSLALFEEMHDNPGIAKCLLNYGLVYNALFDYPNALLYCEKALDKYVEIGDKKGIAGCLSAIGIVYSELYNYPTAMEYFEKSLKLEEEINDKRGIGENLGQIAGIYEYLSDLPNALDYYEQSLKIKEELGDFWGTSVILRNIGVIYGKKSNYSNAIDYYDKSLSICEKMGYLQGIAYALVDLGSIYNELFDFSKALEYSEKALKISNDLNDKPAIATIKNQIGIIYAGMSDYSKALDYFNKSLSLAREIGNLAIEQECLHHISDVYDKMGQSKKSLVYYKQYIALRDSFINEEKMKQITEVRMKYEYAKKLLTDSLANEEEKLRSNLSYKEALHEKNNQRNIFLVGGLGILLLAGGLWSRLRYIRRSTAIIKKEKERSENLLLNILPVEIARELIEKGKADAKSFENVSVLFADFKDFTGTTEKLSAKELVSEINTYFEAFDGIIGKYSVEKIKTIGDSYMAAGGLPVHLKDSVKNTVKAGLEMQAFMIRRKQEQEAQGLPAFDMRLGIHTGPVIAGIVGVKKFQYDIWGDTVNIAARMENKGEIRKVNISQTTFEFIKDDPFFNFEYRGKIEAKNKGDLDMYFVANSLNH